MQHSSSPRELFEILVNGLSHGLWIPFDVTQLIKAYYTFSKVDWNIFLFFLHQSTLYHITSSSKYKQSLSPGYKTEPQYIANRVKLPKYIAELLISGNYYGSKFEKTWKQIQPSQFVETQFDSTWSLMFQFGVNSLGNTCYVTAFDLTKTCNSYQVYLPSMFGATSDIPSIAYNKKDGILYSMNSKYSMRSIYGLNINESPPNWKLINNKLLIPRYNTSLCMIDNDRFIAILGGDKKGNESSNAELYAFNCNKSIKLSDMNYIYKKSICLYHDMFHKIIICDKNLNYNKLEWHDINKDKWIKLKNATENVEYIDFRAKQMVISDKNPNILLITGIVDSQYEIHEIDLRINTYKSQCVWNHNEQDFGNNFYNVWMLQM